jgi:hypothetical protein
MISSLKTWSSQGQLTLIVEASAASFIPELSFEWSSPDASLSLLCEMCGSHQGKLSLKSNELSDSAGEFHIIFDTSLGETEPRKASFQCQRSLGKFGTWLHHRPQLLLLVRLPNAIAAVGSR